MVSTEVTQNSPQSSSDSVRITAVTLEQRRRILREHYMERLERQQAVVTLERGIRNSNASGTPHYTHADLRVSNTIAVLQDISAMVKSFGDENRDFPAVAK